MIKELDLNLLKTRVKKFKEMSWPDDDLIENILFSLGILDIVELDFALKNRVKRERDAAMDMLERYLDDLTSGDKEKWADAKDTLHQIYYQIESTDEEASL